MPWTSPVLYIGPDNTIRDELPVHPGSGFVRIVAVADSHTQERLYHPLPPADLLIFGGDMLFKNVDADGKPSIEKAYAWLKEQSYRKLVFIAGNHEAPLEEMGAAASREAFPGYIEDEFVEFERFVKF